MISKFRAWDKVKRSIILVSEIVYSSDLSYINRVTLDGRDHKMLYGSETRQEDDVVLMQSTGLHDQNGVEIFQGDVVKIVYDGEPFTGVVVYDLEETDFKATNGNEDYGNNFQYLTVGESIEVIGNVHQNPELLGE